MDLSHSRICDYCGEIIAAALNFQGANDSIICIDCVKCFYSVYRKHETEKSIMRRNIIFNDPMPDHNFVVLPGGKK